MITLAFEDLEYDITNVPAKDKRDVARSISNLRVIVPCVCTFITDTQRLGPYQVDISLDLSKAETQCAAGSASTVKVRGAVLAVNSTNRNSPFFKP